MAINHTRTIENLRVLNNGNNIVCEVQVEWTSSDDSDIERTTINSSETYEVETEETVEGWIATELAEQTVTERHESWINSVLNPPAPRRINKTTPW
jgi:hypothetical protein